MNQTRTLQMHLLNDAIYEVVDVQPDPQMVGQAFRIRLRQPETGDTLSFRISCSPTFARKLQLDGAFAASSPEEALLDLALSRIENLWDGPEKAELPLNPQGDYQLPYWS